MRHSLRYKQLIMANLQNKIKKTSKHFEVSITCSNSSSANPTEFKVTGVGYRFKDDNERNDYDLEIDEIFQFDDISKKWVNVPVQLIESFMYGERLKNHNLIYVPCITEVINLFYTEDESFNKNLLITF